jgi:hypothetical protein
VKEAVETPLGSGGPEPMLGVGGAVASTENTGKSTTVVALSCMRSFQAPSFPTAKLTQGRVS